MTTDTPTWEVPEGDQELGLSRDHAHAAGSALDFVRHVARLERSGDEGYVHPDDPDDANHALDGLIAKARDLLTAPPDPEPSGGWRPIESAPKTTENVAPICILLAWFNLTENGGRSYQVGEGYWHPDGGIRAEGGWWWANTTPGDYYSDPIEESITGHVTHWLPLPASPKVTPEGGA